jgi:hypothetical protein
MSDKKLDHYNPNYPYRKGDIAIDMDNKSGYPMLQRLNNAALYPEAIRNTVDMEQLKPFH